MVWKGFWKEPPSVIGRERELRGPRVEVRVSLLEAWLEADPCALAKKACLAMTRTSPHTRVKITGVLPRKVGRGNVAYTEHRIKVSRKHQDKTELRKIPHGVSSKF